MKLGYADPPYIGCAHLYADHPDYAGEVDHAALLDRLVSEFDGWVLHAAATPRSIAVLAPLVERIEGARWCSWTKGFAAFKRNVPVAYAWEPVVIKPARKPVVSKRLVMRDWIECSITLRRGLTGAKPEAVCHWAFELLGSRPIPWDWRGECGMADLARKVHSAGRPSRGDGRVTPATSTREKIARAIYEKRNGRGATPWARRSKSHQEPYLADADAALDALMEHEAAYNLVTDEIVERFDDHNYHMSTYHCVGEAFRAMILAAKEGK